MDGSLTSWSIMYQDDQQRLDSLMLEKWNQVCFWVESIRGNHEFTKSVTLLFQSFCIAHCSSCLSCSGNFVGDLQESLSMLITSPTKRRTTMIPSSLFLYRPSSLVLSLVIVLPWDWVHHNWSGGFSGPRIHPLAGLFCPFPSLHCMRYSPCTSSNTNSWLGNTNRHNQIHPKKGEEVHEGSPRLHVKEDYSISANFGEKISRRTKQTPGRGTKKTSFDFLTKEYWDLELSKNSNKIFCSVINKKLQRTFGFTCIVPCTTSWFFAVVYQFSFSNTWWINPFEMLSVLHGNMWNTFIKCMDLHQQAKKLGTHQGKSCIYGFVAHDFWGQVAKLLQQKKEPHHEQKNITMTSL